MFSWDAELFIVWGVSYFMVFNLWVRMSLPLLDFFVLGAPNADLFIVRGVPYDMIVLVWYFPNT